MKKDQYVIVDLKKNEVMKDINGEIKYYDSEEGAKLICGLYEFENVWVVKLVYNHIEN